MKLFTFKIKYFCIDLLQIIVLQHFILFVNQLTDINMSSQSAQVGYIIDKKTYKLHRHGSMYNSSAGLNRQSTKIRKIFRFFYLRLNFIFHGINAVNSEVKAQKASNKPFSFVETCQEIGHPQSQTNLSSSYQHMSTYS